MEKNNLDKSKKIIISVAFNSIKYSDKRLTEEWIANRLDIFFRYTLRSLKCQTNQEFTTYLRYDPLSEKIIKEELSRRTPLPGNIQFVVTEIEKKLIEDTCQEYDKLYLVRLDSDNLYKKDFIQQLYDAQPKEDTEAIINQYGYLFHEKTQKLTTYYQMSPPFYTMIYKPKEFIRGKRYVTPGGHGSVTRSCKCEFLNGFNYMVTIHESNVSNGAFLMGNKSGIIREEAMAILKDFGISI